MRGRTALVPLLFLSLALPASAAAQDAAPTETFCFSITAPEGSSIDVTNVGDFIGLVDVTTALIECPLEDDTVPEGVAVPLGVAGDIDNGAWEVVVSKVNGNAWSAVRKENMFNDAPPRNNRIVMVEVRAKNTGDQARDPFYPFNFGLFSTATDEQFERYEGVLPRGFSNVGEVPPGRAGRGNIAFIVPKSTKLSDLELYISGDDTYLNYAITD